MQTHRVQKSTLTRVEIATSVSLILSRTLVLFSLLLSSSSLLFTVLSSEVQQWNVSLSFSLSLLDHVLTWTDEITHIWPRNHNEFQVLRMVELPFTGPLKSFYSYDFSGKLWVFYLYSIQNYNSISKVVNCVLMSICSGYLENGVSEKLLNHPKLLGMMTK